MNRPLLPSPATSLPPVTLQAVATPDRNTIDADDGTPTPPTDPADPSDTSLTTHALHTLRTAARHGPTEDLADRLCAAGTTLLGVDGASLAAAYTPTMSVPVGASDLHAATAEQAQFTTGEGPCLHAHLTWGTALATDVADADSAARRYWPAYTLLLGRTTTFRSVVAVPVPVPAPGLLAPGPQSTPPSSPPAPTPAPTPAGPPEQGTGATAGPNSSVPLVRVPLVLTCYSQRPLPAATASSEVAKALQVRLRRIQTVSAALGTVLAEVTAAAASTEADWLDSRTAGPRAAVWQAEEALMDADSGVDRDGALAALRTYALIHAISIDEVAAELVQGHLGAGQVLGHHP